MRARRDVTLVSISLFTLVVASIGAIEATSWVGRPFAGFLLLENGVVASAGLGHWPAVADGAIYQHEVVKVDGRTLEDAEALLFGR